MGLRLRAVVYRKQASRVKTNTHTLYPIDCADLNDKNIYTVSDFGCGLVGFNLSKVHPNKHKQTQALLVESINHT